MSELVTNAVQHARVGPDRLVLVRFELTGDQLRIEVHDASSARLGVRAAGALEEFGRGLRLVDALATRWGVCPRAGGVGKVTWCTIGPGPGPEPVTVEISRLLPATRYGSPAEGLAALWEALRFLPLDGGQHEAYRHFLTRPDAAERTLEFLNRDGLLELTFTMRGESHVVRVRPALACSSMGSAVRGLWDGARLTSSSP